VPLYYFEPEGQGWDYQDDDGIKLQSDAEALAYAYSIIGELKADYEGSHRPGTCLSRTGFARQSSALPSNSFSSSASCASRADLSRRCRWRREEERQGAGSVSLSSRWLKTCVNVERDGYSFA
jgi:hypothetical protein